MAKKLKWNLILMSVLYLALGVFLLLVPGTALNVVCYALGAVVLVCAVIQLVRYFAVERGIFQSQLTLISGLICLGLGAFLIFRSDVVVRILPIVFGLFVIFDSLGRIQNALELRKCQYPSWKGFLLLAVLSIVLGIIMAAPLRRPAPRRPAHSRRCSSRCPAPAAGRCPDPDRGCSSGPGSISISFP